MSSDNNGRTKTSLHPASNWLAIVLLSAILVTQILILRRMPPPTPTLQTLQDAKTPQARATIIRNIPLARVHGSVEAEVTGSVAIENTPLEVEVSR